ncbi:response regulator transcription factor [Frankia sp. AgB1.9]|uniref:response regulator transcription factor n=1 Tax=unclassified Frankia TaxID=2632575 RepID=UPI001931B0DE|nr:MULTISPECIES: response regulator transcription factor [unclassified Frankia]MBL7486494.1 response regulator transcription factor [Frankia sp. AgW1.1]MBL7554017.1 response regulator transcription factor [Frankia sp. AgB1.9]MBL7618190.1 response regulator transcription factor [Frankia sp. AgB1.8]
MRVIVADDSVIVREGVRRLLEAEGHEVVDLVGDALAIPAAVAHGQPDAVVLDLRMPPTFTDEGLRAALSLRAAASDLGVLLLSQHAVPEYATLLLAGGARATGYLLKDRILAPRQLSETLGILAAGGTVVDPDVVGALLAAGRRDDPIARLSASERAVLELMAQGLSDRGIAQRLFVSVNTVGTHVGSVFRKLDLPAGATDNRRVLAVLTYLEHR